MEQSLGRRKIQSLNGLKAFAILGVFWQHCNITILPFDMGARTCEFLFVASGFLVAYNHFDRECPATWSESLRYTCEKLIRMWPLHFLTFLLVFLFGATGPSFSKTDLMKAAMNVSLLQAWSPDGNVFFSYNGATWFLSALLFCYFMAPVLLRFSRDKMRSSIYFVVVASLRFLLEYVPQVTDVKFWNLNMHVSPIIRCLEFFMGMLLVPLFFQIQQTFNKTMKNHKYLFHIVFTFLEGMTAIGVLIAMWKMDTVWMRVDFVLLFSIAVFIFAFDSGLFSRLLSLKVIGLISTVQLEFYLFHQAFIKTVARPYSLFFESDIIVKILIFATTLLSAWLYHLFLLKPLSALLRKIINKIFAYMHIQIAI